MNIVSTESRYNTNVRAGEGLDWEDNELSLMLPSSCKVRTREMRSAKAWIPKK